MRLLDDICFILKEGTDLLKKGSAAFPSGIHFSLLIDKSNLIDISSIYKYISSSSSPFKFSLTFNLSLPDLQSVSPFTLAAFFFLPNYKLLDGKPVINLLPSKEGNSKSTQNLLEKISTEQRFGGVACNKLTLYNHLDYTGSNNQRVENPSEAIRRMVFDRDWLREESDFVGATISSTNEMEDFVQELKKSECEFQEVNPQVYSLLVARKELFREVESLKIKVQHLAEDLNNEKTYNAFLKENHQAKLLQEYYDHEYEVLPTWFKRLGHIIKFITGKRRLFL
ncbi:hypothetical protein [Rufibacter latericius]|uniref:Uncharacterized protein n=1 Tax=Rufibacter latericius TaxID=2487040 RepID=A0A3M9MWT2_9BACT|nr:hypothetical protein [Rufibacter latericius]RNI29228.1 hypothetical protein EFB08_07350 [Rufibacter latericius]